MPVPSEQIKAGRDLRQTAPVVGPATSRSGTEKLLPRHCEERSDEAIQGRRRRVWIASSQTLLAMTKGKRNAEKRCSTTAASCDAARPPPSSSPACGGRTQEGVARLSAFHHGTCGSDRTPPLSSSHATSWEEFGAHVPMVRKTERIATHDAKPTVGLHAPLAGITRALLSQPSEIAPAARS
jgi:hypothetical protein